MCTIPDAHPANGYEPNPAAWIHYLHRHTGAQGFICVWWDYH